MATMDVPNPDRNRQIAEILQYAYNDKKQRELAEKYGLLDQLESIRQQSITNRFSEGQRYNWEVNKSAAFKSLGALREKRKRNT